MDAQRLSDSILKLNSSRCSVYWHTHTCCTRTAVAILTPAEVVRCSKDGKVTEAAREAERAAVRSNLAALWHSETSQPSGEQASVHDLGVSAERVRRGEGKDVTPSHSHQPLPRHEMQEPSVSRCSVSWCSVSLLSKYKSTKPDGRAAGGGHSRRQEGAHAGMQRRGSACL